MTVMVKREWLRVGNRVGRLGREKAHLDLSAFTSVAWLVGLAMATIIFYIWQHLQIIRSGYEIEVLRKRLDTLTSRNSLLTVEAASLRDLRLVEKRAVFELDMVQPTPGQIVRLSPPETRSHEETQHPLQRP